MLIEMSDRAAQTLMALLEDEPALWRARNTGRERPVPAEEDVQDALARLDAGDDDEPQPGDERLATAEERSQARQAYARANSAHVQRFGRALPSDHCIPEEADLAGRLAERTGISFPRALAALRGRRGR